MVYLQNYTQRTHTFNLEEHLEKNYKSSTSKYTMHK